jgi:Cu(I)/Ag(I) efflux system membrane protein CusA/SilA
VTTGPSTIRTENAQLAAYIFVDIARKQYRWLRRQCAQKVVAEQVVFPQGYYVAWSGQFEYLERAQKMKLVIPVTLLIIFLLLYLNFKRLTETFIVMLSVPFSLVGGLWLMWWMGYNMSVAVAVGFIALAGVAAETGVVMLIYLDHAWLNGQTPRQ